MVVMRHFSLSKFNVLYVYLAPRAKPEGVFRGLGAPYAILCFWFLLKEREHHNTMKNTAQEGARGRAGRDSPPPQQPLDILNTCAVPVYPWRGESFAYNGSRGGRVR